MKTLLIISTMVIGCQSQYQITKQDREDFKKYPEAYLAAYGKKEAVKARRLEITDSLRKAHEMDVSKEYLEEYSNNKDQERD